VDGTETGWGRAAEPAPRWRALLDRARLGGRNGEQDDVDERRAGAGGPNGAAGEWPGRDTGAAGESPGRGAGAEGYPEHGTGLPYPADLNAPGTPAGAEPDGGWAGESRYAALESGYRPDLGRTPGPRYAAPPAEAPATPRYSWPTEPTPPAESSYGAPSDPRYAALPADPRYAAPPALPAAPAPPADSRYAAPPAEGRYASPPAPPADPRYAAPAAPTTPAAPVDSRYPAPPAVPAPVVAAAPAPAAPAESRYAMLEPGYRPESGYPAGSPGAAPDAGRQRRTGWRANRGADAEVERAVNVLRRDLGTPRVLAFANPKGGVHKTTATVLAAATVGSVRGRGVLAWDDNELRGTLGLRAGSARHARTIRHLVTDLAEIEARHGAGLTDRLDDYLRHASDGSYDVLAGEESPRFAQRLDQHTVRRVLELLRRTHEVICVDTGNNVESVNWQTVLQAADQLVITTVPREDAAFTADWMLDLLHEIGMGELAENAVTLLSCPTPGRSPLLGDLEKHFATRTRAVAVVPYDPSLETGSSIEYAHLQHETRQAWLRAASMMVEPFAR
jgi:MinD-like ATPase involved in chromosome partitioning or flagellar assembly